MSLPPFPVDDGTLDMLWSALGNDPGAERSSVSELLTLYSQLGGSDTDAVESVDDGIFLMRDPQYHEHDILSSLITEVRRLRASHAEEKS